MNLTLFFKFKKNQTNTLGINHTWPKYDSYLISMINKLKKNSIHTLDMIQTIPKYYSYLISMIHTKV